MSESKRRHPQFWEVLHQRGLRCSRFPTTSRFAPLTYVLALEIREPATIEVGRLARPELDPGWLYYVGSAKRAGSHRLRRHLETEKRIHWHIDYLTTNPAVQFWGILGWENADQRECELVAELARRPGLAFAVPGFGTGDCRSGCVSHLLATTSAAAHRDLWQWLLRRQPQPFLRCQAPDGPGFNLAGVSANE